MHLRSHPNQEADTRWQRESQFFSMESNWVYLSHTLAQGLCPEEVGQHKTNCIFLLMVGVYVYFLFCFGTFFVGQNIFLLVILVNFGFCIFMGIVLIFVFLIFFGKRKRK